MPFFKLALMTILILLHQNAFSEEKNCVLDESFREIYQFSAVSCDMAIAEENPLAGEVEANGSAKGLLYSGLRCFQGVGDGIIGTVKGFYELGKGITVDLPSWLYRKMTSDEKDNEDDNENKVESVEVDPTWTQKLSMYTKLAQQKLRDEYTGYNCLPASLRTKMLCEMISGGFLLVVAPGKVAEGANSSLKMGEALERAMAKMKGTAKEMSGAAKYNQIKKVTSFSVLIDSKAGAKVSHDLKNILSRHSSLSSGRMNGLQYNNLYDDLMAFAQKYDIKIKHTTEFKGVYPKGLNQLDLAGVKRMVSTSAEASKGDRHELAHLFHTLQMRATILESLAARYPKGKVPDEIIQDAESYLKHMENGNNYLELEKAVTTASGFGNIGERANSASLYSQRVEKLIEGTEKGLMMEKVVLPSGYTLEDIYGLIISKTPIVLGKSGAELLTTRLPPILFATVYANNYNVGTYGIDPRAFGIDRSDMPFREFVSEFGAKMATEAIAASALIPKDCRPCNHGN